MSEPRHTELLVEIREAVVFVKHWCIAMLLLMAVGFIWSSVALVILLWR